MADAIPSGIYLLGMQFGRGTNLKFKNDAIVHVVCNGVTKEGGLTAMDYDKAMQCSGRGSRRMGLNRSFVYLFSQHAG